MRIQSEVQPHGAACHPRLFAGSSLTVPKFSRQVPRTLRFTTMTKAQSDFQAALSLLGIERIEDALPRESWAAFYVGHCDGGLLQKEDQVGIGLCPVNDPEWVEIPVPSRAMMPRYMNLYKLLYHACDISTPWVQRSMCQYYFWGGSQDFEEHLEFNEITREEYEGVTPDELDAALPEFKEPKLKGYPKQFAKQAALLEAASNLPPTEHRDMDLEEPLDPVIAYWKKAEGVLAQAYDAWNDMAMQVGTSPYSYLLVRSGVEAIAEAIKAVVTKAEAVALGWEIINQMKVKRLKDIL